MRANQMRNLKIPVCDAHGFGFCAKLMIMCCAQEGKHDMNAHRQSVARCNCFPCCRGLFSLSETSWAKLETLVRPDMQKRR